MLTSLLTIAAFLTGAGEADRYRSLVEALGRGDFAHAHQLAPGFTEGSALARKAGFLDELAAFLARTAPPPAGAAAAVAVEAGALRAALSRDGAFAAAVVAEGGVGGYHPILFGWPRPWSSRISLWLDGEPMMLDSSGSVIAREGTLVLTTRAADLEVRVELTAAAPAASDARADASASLALAVAVTNRGAATRMVGVRALLDVVQEFVDAPLVRLGQRTVLDSVIDFQGDDVPRSLVVGEREVVLRGLGERGVDRVVLAPLEAALDAPFDFQVVPGAFGPDSCLVVYRDPEPLAPGAATSLRVRVAEPADDTDGRPPVRTSAWAEPLRGGETMPRA
ncbi:MAG: hypothetical protein U1E76_00060 [Planctomycetota bacterium]